MNVKQWIEARPEFIRVLDSNGPFPDATWSAELQAVGGTHFFAVLEQGDWKVQFGTTTVIFDVKNQQDTSAAYLLEPQMEIVAFTQELQAQL